MLALFDKNIKHPEILPRYKNLFVEKIQCPLALNPSAEDDQVVSEAWENPCLTPAFFYYNKYYFALHRLIDCSNVADAQLPGSLCAWW